MKKIKLLLIAALSGLTFFAVQQVQTFAETATIEITPNSNPTNLLWFIGWNGSATTFGENLDIDPTIVHNVENPNVSFSIIDTKDGQNIDYRSLAFKQHTTFQLLFSSVKVSFTCLKENGKYFLDQGTMSGTKTNIAEGTYIPPLMGISSGDFHCSFHWEFLEDVQFYNFGANFTIKNNGLLTTRTDTFLNSAGRATTPKINIENGGKFECSGPTSIYNTNIFIENGGEFCITNASYVEINDAEFVNNGLLTINSSNVRVINGASFSTGENSFTNLGNNSTLTLENSGNNILNGTITINSDSTLKVNTNATINGVLNINTNNALNVQGDITINGTVNNNGGSITGDGGINDTNAKKRNIHNNLSDNIKPIGYFNPSYTGSSYDLVYNDSTQDLSDNVAKTIITTRLSNKQVVNVRKIVFSVITNITSGTLTFDYNHPEIKKLLGNLGNYRILKFENGKWIDGSKSNSEALVTSTTKTTTIALVGYSTKDLPTRLPITDGTTVTKQSVKLGKTIKLYVDTTEKVTWSSKNKKIATVDKNGKVLGLKSGTTTITAKYGKKTNTFTITVEKVKKSYTVKTKTTLAKLAKTLKVSVADLKKWNKKLAKAKIIKAKTKVVYYKNGTYHVPVKKVYKTTKKITLKQLAKQLKVSETNLKKWNKSLSKAKFVKAKVKVVYYR